MQIGFLNTADTVDKRNYLYYLNSTYLGPFDSPNDEIKKFIKLLQGFQLIYEFKTLVPYQNYLDFECYSWKITQDYSFDQRAHFILRLNTEMKNCEDKNISHISDFAIFINKLLWIHILVFVIALSSFILTWKYIYKIAKLYWRIKHQLQNEPAYDNDINNNNKINSHDFISGQNTIINNNISNTYLNSNININLSNSNNYDNKVNSNINFNNTNTNINSKTNGASKWDQLNIKEKGKFFNKWSIICLVGNLIQLFGSFLSLLNYQNETASSEMLIGFGCMFAYINIGRYLDYNKDYSTIYATISRALPNVLRYLLGVLPIFFGFIFFGLCLFWRSERFTSTSSTMMTLFAVLNGDSVFDVFNDLAGVSFFLGQVYCYCFCIVFIV